MTYNLLFFHSATGVRSGHGGGTLLSIPRRLAVLGGAADGQGVDAGCVAITVTVVPLRPSIA